MHNMLWIKILLKIVLIAADEETRKLKASSQHKSSKNNKTKPTKHDDSKKSTSSQPGTQTSTHGKEPGRWSFNSYFINVNF